MQDNSGAVSASARQGAASGAVRAANQAASRLKTGSTRNKLPVASSAPVATRTLSRPHYAPRFVVELSRSAHPVDPLDVPQLDVFELYHLYRGSEPRDGRTLHSLRLGYFKEPGHAKALAAYLAPYFRNPIVAQIDVAEILSSLRQRLVPGKEIGASGQHATVVLATAPRPRNPAEVPPPAPDAALHSRPTWSRLLHSLCNRWRGTQ